MLQTAFGVVSTVAGATGLDSVDDTEAISSKS